MLRHVTLSILAALTAFACLPASAQRSAPWEDARQNRDQLEQVLLGKVSYRNDQSDVVFSIERGPRIKEILIRALDRPVLIDFAEIRYANGRSDRVDILNRLRPGEATRPIIVKPRRARVTEVVIRKRAGWRPTPRGELELIGLAQPDLEPEIGSNFVVQPFAKIASKAIPRANRRGVFDFGTTRKRYKSIRIRNQGRTMRLRAVTVIFGNNERRVVELNQRLRRGTVSRSATFQKPRRIKRIVIRQRALERRGSRQIVVEAQEARRAAPPVWGGVGRPIPPDWVLFGAEDVSFKADRDVIKVGKRVGRFDHIALRVFDNDIFLRELTIVYGNNQRDRRVIDTEFRAGSQTKPIALDGARYIDRIEMVYRARPGQRRIRATVEVYGDPSRRYLEKRRTAQAKPQWALLGAQRATPLKKDTDAIVVGKRFGRIKAVRLAALRNDLRIYSVTAVYGNGDQEQLPLTGKLRKGRTTDVVEIGNRRGRFIERLIIRHRSKLSLRGPGILEAWGLH